MERVIMRKEYVVKEVCILKDFLEKNMTDISKHKRKSLLTNGVIEVNGKVQTKYNYPLKVGDKITCREKEIPTSLNILYEDDDIIVVDKPSGVLTVGTDKHEDNTLYREVSYYVKQKKVSNRIFIVHRLDKDTSGIILFCKNQKLKRMFQDYWNELVLKREYVGITEGVPKQKKGTVIQYLKENEQFMVYATSSKEGKKAITNYEVIEENGRYAYVRFQLETGRKNQIRVACKSLGCPLVGDKKYGAKTNPMHRLLLHASMFACIHPVTHKKLQFSSKIPKNFQKLTK